jgi:uncharacterized repeat protein (TIGR03803 family)
MTRFHAVPIALFAAVLAASPALAGADVVVKAKATLLYNFLGLPNDGNQPLGSLTPGPGGVLYGTTASGGGANAGTVFELTPPATGQGAWTETVIHSFSGPDGASPQSTLVIDGKGNLYGTAVEGGPAGSFGVVFELSPPVTGSTAWTETVVTAFTGRNGADPYARLVIDAKGNLYGTTARGGLGFTSGAFSGYGVVFELTPPASGQTAWTEKVRHYFDGGSNFFNLGGNIPTGGLAIDSAGSLYGTTAGGGGTGCGSGCGTVFKLTPTQTTAWTRTTLHVFNFTDGYDPVSSLALDRSGNLYGTTAGGGKYGKGVVFRLVAPAIGRPTTAKPAYTYQILHNFTGAGDDGANPQGDVVLDAAGNVYVTTPGGGTQANGVFKFSPIADRKTGLWTETVFSVPEGAIGATIKAGVIVDEAGNIYGAASVGGASGNGVIFELTP